MPVRCGASRIGSDLDGEQVAQVAVDLRQV